MKKATLLIFVLLVLSTSACCCGDGCNMKAAKDTCESKGCTWHKELTPPCDVACATGSGGGPGL